MSCIIIRVALPNEKIEWAFEGAHSTSVDGRDPLDDLEPMSQSQDLDRSPGSKKERTVDRIEWKHAADARTINCCP
jgi:hypothetical protein